MTPQELRAALARPFDPKDVKRKPQVVKNNRAFVIAYIDARLVQDRLDEVLGVEGWEDRYEILPDGSVVCTLRIRFGEEWIAKSDVGSPSEQPDGGDRLKAAFSDALKRAAVKFGIGRYLYRMGGQWVDYDPVKKQVLARPTVDTPAVPASVESRIRSAANEADLLATWSALSPEEKKHHAAAKDAAKARLNGKA